MAGSMVPTATKFPVILTCRESKSQNQISSFLQRNKLVPLILTCSFTFFATFEIKIHPSSAERKISKRNIMMHKDILFTIICFFKNVDLSSK
jgi:hypothetical protein